MIEQIKRPVYRSPLSNRCFLTLRAAVNSEASAMLESKYPKELAEYEGGVCYFSGYHWSSDERLVRAHRRLMRLILRAFRATQPKAAP